MTTLEAGRTSERSEPVATTTTPRHRLAWIQATGLTAAILLASLLTYLTEQPLWAVCAALTVAVAVHSVHLGWRMACGTITASALVLQLCYAWLMPHIGWSVSTDAQIGWLLFGLAHAGYGAFSGPIRVKKRQLWDLAAALTGPALIALYFWRSLHRPGPAWVSWAMSMDTANNTVLNRELITQGGLLRAQGNGAPMTTVLHGVWDAPGYSGIGPAGDLGRQLILSSAHLSVMLFLFASFVAGVVALNNFTGPWLARVIAAVSAGLLPWAWFVSGNSFAYGYQNAPTAIVVLVVTWLIWRHHSEHPSTALTGLILITWATGTTWGPVAVIPAFLMIAATIVDRRELLQAGWRLVVPGVALVAAASYAYLVTLRDVSAGGSALILDGAHPNFDWHYGLGFAIGLGVLSVAGYRWLPKPVVHGLWAVLPAVALGCYSLIRVRHAMPEWWGYYPIKFTWLAISAMLIIGFAECVPLIRRLAGRFWGGSGMVVLLLLAGWLMVQMSPPVRPMTLSQIATPVGLHDQTARDPAVSRLFRILNEHPKSIVARYSPDGIADDSFTNFWMLGLGAESLADPIRQDAYGMDSSNPQAVCDAITRWEGGVVVWTLDPKLEQQMARRCDPAFSYEVKVLPPWPKTRPGAN